MMSKLPATFILFFLLLVPSIVLFFRFRIIFKSRIKKFPIDWCTSEEAILLVQRKQWLKAKEEVFGNSQVANDFEFYKRTFGVVRLMLGPNRRNLTSLAYYRIYKNGNDNIRSLLLEYAYSIDHRQSDYEHHCRNQSETCIHRRIQHFSPMAMNTLYPSRHHRYAFAFTREPISRFLSAVTEIEYRMQEAIRRKGKHAALPLFQHARGSPLRFQEIVKFLLSNDGASSWFQKYRDLQLVHLVPQFPTILLGQKIEKNDFHIYRLDQFDEHWEMISNQTTAYSLQTLYLAHGKRDVQPHPTSLDPYNTTLAAKSFLSYSSLDAYHR
jgi:hypothetical protein